MKDKINILVVDDREEGILAVQAVLTSPDYNLVVAHSGNDALKNLLTMDFAVILLDVQMPIMNGFETAAIIKTREKSRDIPIIFMSAINQDEMYVYQGYDVGAVDYLLKPFDPYILKSKVSVFVDIYRKKQLIKKQNQKLIENEINLHTMEMANQELESLKRYRTLADSIPHIVFKIGSEGETEYFNKVWFEYTGLNENENHWRNVIHPHDLENVLNLFENNTSKEGKETECRLLNRLGFYRCHLIRVQPEIYEENKITSWIGTATDIQERKQAEENQRFLAQAGEIIVSSLDKDVILNNLLDHSIPFFGEWCAYDFLNSFEELVTEHLKIDEKNSTDNTKKIIHLIKNISDEYSPYKKVLKTKEPEIFEYIGKHLKQCTKKNTEEYALAEELTHTNLMLVPICAQDSIIGILSFAMKSAAKEPNSNLLELGNEIGKRLSLAITNSLLYTISQQAIETRNHFLSIASHELNTPITTLKLHLQMISKTLKKDTNTDYSKFSKSLEGSIHQVDRLIKLVQVLLDVSHIQSDKFKLSFEDINVSDIVHEIVDRQREILANYNCTLDLKVSPNLHAVWDKTRIEQVFINLITNAIKYAPGHIEVHVEKEGENIKISVRDFGKGIPKDKLNSIFDRFERVSNNDNIGGLGLGLFIVKQIIEGHKGTIDITSEIDKGTCFNILLPRSPTAEVQIQG
jgi:PAS domain S-box-containing protein